LARKSSAPIYVPKAQMKLARSFNCGFSVGNRTSPAGAAELIEFMSYVSAYFHCVFSTKERRRLITPDLRERLWPFLGGIARQNKMKALEIGGVEDHVHILLSLPATITVSKAMQLIKGSSSKWVHETFPEHRQFAWQEEYGAFSVSVSQLEKTVEYIREQPEHHRKMTFQDEFLVLLKRHRVEYDERFLWK
jgi:putative transposase